MTEMPTKIQALVERAAAKGEDALTYLDPRQLDERKAIEYFLDRSGKSADRYPALHLALAHGEWSVPKAPLDQCTLVDAGRAEDGTATASTWVGSAGRPFLSGAHTMLVDRDGGGVLASGSSTQVGGGLMRNATDADAAAATPRMTGISFFHAQRSPEEPVRFGLSAAPVTPMDGELKFTIEAPIEITHTPTHPVNRVVIGMARQQGWVNTDCDYVYPEAANIEPDRLVVPFVGNVEFPMNVTLPALKIRTWLWCGYTPLATLQTESELAAGFTAPAANRIAWKFPFDDKSIRETASLRYEPFPEADDNLSAFLFKFQVMGGGVPQPVTICSLSWPHRPSSGCGSVLDLQFWWHCVEAGAQVTLGDGSKMPLKEIDNRTEVQTVTGGKALVEATTLDIHDTDSEDIVMKLETKGGRSLVLSALHPLFVGGAPVMARDLKQGDEIAVEGGGTDHVSSCEAFPSYAGQLGNLKLAGSGTQGFYANGIAVGDFSTMSDHREETRHDPDYMLSCLPKSHHQDYLSALADATDGQS